MQAVATWKMFIDEEHPEDKEEQLDFANEGSQEEG